MATLYIGCSLTQAPEGFKQNVEELKQTLRTNGHTVLDFIGLVAGTAKDVYEWDIHQCVEKCDVFVAICDYPAIGLGYELGVAVEKLNKPTLVLAHTDAKITRLVQGIECPNYAIVRYSSFSDIPKHIEVFVTKSK
ncbi:MAG: hypothetical protein AAB955_01735 [Patescibacteria group bacterium]